MARDSVIVDKYDGVSTFISKENRPIKVMQKLVNLRHGEKFGRAVKRKGYSSLLSTGLTTLKRMIEFKNKNAEIVLALMDGNTLERSIYSGGSYGAIAAITNDERTAGSTIDGDSFHPVIINKEMRAGAGNSVATQRPIWFGYIAARNRFNDVETITAGRYLDEQYYIDSGKFYTSFINEISSTIAGEISGSGLAIGKYAVYLAPVYDGYQRGLPILTNIWEMTAAENCMSIELRILNTDAEDLKRLTAIDVFVAPQAGTYFENFGAAPAYFLERVDLNDDGKYFLEVSGNVGVTTANKIVIDTMSDWLLFSPFGMFVYDVTNDNYYEVTGYVRDTPGAGQVELTTDPVAAADGAATLQFLSRWHDDGIYYKYYTFYDNYYKKLGAEIYAYLNIPSGDTGLDDFRYKFAAYNGNRALYTGFPTDTNFSYFSANEAPDVVPSLNVFRHKHDAIGNINVGRDFFVFTERGIERISIYGNQQTEQDDEFSNSILASTKSIRKVSDEMIAFMSYGGPKLLAGRKEIPIGEQLLEWWNTTLTQAQKEACVAGYNFLHDELYFSFPTYTTSPYTNGIIFVFDLKAWRNEYISPWWFWACDTPIYAFEGPNSVQHLLAGGLTKVLDFDGAGSESFSTSYKIKLLQNIVPNKKVWWDRVFADVETSDTVTANLYFDGSSTAVALSLNTDLNGFIRYMKKTLELELATAASVNTVEHKGCLLTFTPRSK